MFQVNIKSLSLRTRGIITVKRLIAFFSFESMLCFTFYVEQTVLTEQIDDYKSLLIT